jgi:hypothetical protein
MTRSSTTRRLFLAVAAMPFLVTLAYAQRAPASLTFIKEFPGSIPPYVSITLRDLGDDKFMAEYRVAPEEDPTELEITAPVAERAFALAKELEYFGGPKIESGRKVAQMGKKTLRYESGSQPSTEMVYNYTELPAAVELTSWFEKLANTQGHVDRILYLLRFDKLGIVKELLQAEMDLNNDRLLQPTLLLPALKKVLANKSLVNVAHERANGILARLTPAQ